MFIVTNTTETGCYTPSVFIRRESAAAFKRNLALYDAYDSCHYIDYNKTLDKPSQTLFYELFERIGKNTTITDFSEKERKLMEDFEAYLKDNGCTFGEKTDCIVYYDDSYNCIELFEVPAPCDIQTSAGMATAVAYDDECAKGVQIWLDDNIVCALDVYEEEHGGEARVLVYKKEYGEDEEEAPVACITINR